MADLSNIDQFTKHQSSSLNDNENASRNSFEIEEESLNNISNQDFDDAFMTDNKRTSRNQNEKNRRDQFNSFIQELGLLINNKQKIDKASVLSKAIEYFQENNIKMPKDKEIGIQWKPFFMKNHEFLKFMFDFQNAFCMVFDLNGQIKYVSDEIKFLLDYNPKNIQNQSIFDYIDDRSARELKHILKAAHYASENVQFNCNFRKGDSYASFNVNGYFKCTPNSIVQSLGHFNVIVRLEDKSKIPGCSFAPNTQEDFKVEFSVDLRYTKLDSNILRLMGYSLMEMLGTSAYDYCHLSDLENLTDCHKKIITNKKAISLSYRLMTKGEASLKVTASFSFMEKINSITCKIRLGSTQDVPMLSDTTVSVESESNHTDLSSEFKKRKKSDDLDGFNSKINQENNYEPNKITNYAPVNSIPVIPCNFPTKRPLSMSSSGALPAKTTPLTESHLDESLANIFLRSYNDIQYRKYVVRQFGIKKLSIERSIKKQQQDMKILEDTIENVKDVKKLGIWLMEFQRGKTESNLSVPPASLSQMENSLSNESLRANQTNVELIKSNNVISNNLSQFVSQSNQKTSFDYNGNNNSQEHSRESQSIEIMEKILENYSDANF